MMKKGMRIKITQGQQWDTVIIPYLWFSSKEVKCQEKEDEKNINFCFALILL